MGWSIADAISITGAAPGHACTGCRATIRPRDLASMEYRYPTRTLRFHGHCDDLWHLARGGYSLA
jgi:hypothetical protein